MLKNTTVCFFLFFFSACVYKTSSAEAIKRSIKKTTATATIKKNISIAVAAKIFNTVYEVLEEQLKNKKIEIKLKFIDRGPLPNVYSKWLKHNRVGQISFTKSFLTYQGVNKRVFAGTLCHEFGHFLGQEPTLGSDPLTPIFDRFRTLSVEGQSDYFSTAACLQLVFKKMNWSSETLNQKHNYNCNQSNLTLKQCYGLLNTIVKTVSFYRSVVTNFFYDGKNHFFDPLKKDPYVTSKTIYRTYPSMQCRFDTLIAGLKCSQINKAGRCLNKNGDLLIENRPACWYKK